MFNDWPDLVYSLDIWHFMRRFSSVCTTDAHPLYALFTRRLSASIFEWSAEDLEALVEAKRTEIVVQLIPHPSSDDAPRRLTTRELSRHCHRTTRGIEALLESLMGESGRDTLGVPLFHDDEVWEMWATQKPHVPCIQDPTDILLYTHVSHVKKGTKTLPTYRCARGSTSLESFHLHIARFIPGKYSTAIPLHLLSSFRF